MKKYFLLLSLIFQSTLMINGQSVFASFGTIFSKSKAESPIINAREDFSNSAYPFQFGIEYFISKSKFSVSANYICYAGNTTILLDEPYDPNFPYFHADGHGFNGVNVTRLDLELKYLITKINYPLILKTGLGFGLQRSKSNGYDLYYVPILGPNNVETSPLEAEVYKTTQIVPVGSLEVGCRFFKRIELSLYVQGAIGHKPYERLILKYTYKGMPQPDAIYVADGTSIYVALKVGYRFHRLIKH